MGIDAKLLPQIYRKQIENQQLRQTHALFKSAADNFSGQIKKDRGESPLEAKFDELWRECNGPLLEREAALIPGRLFRVDFLHKESKTVIEIQGFKDHTSRKGFSRDNEKFLLHFFYGYRILALDRHLISKENIKKIIDILSASELCTSQM